MLFWKRVILAQDSEGFSDQESGVRAVSGSRYQCVRFAARRCPNSRRTERGAIALTSKSDCTVQGGSYYRTMPSRRALATASDFEWTCSLA